MILVGYTPTAEGQAALEWATRAAASFGESLTVFQYVRVTEGRPSPEGLETAERELEGLAEGVRRRGVEVTTDVVMGATGAAGELLRYARKTEPSSLVIGIRRRSPVGKLVLGSTSQDILLGAACPVVAVKAPGDTDAARRS